MAKQQSDDGVGRGVYFQGRMRIAWEIRPDETPIHHVDADEGNVRLLRALLLSQDSHRDLSDDSGDRSGDLLRVEAKLDLLMDMVSQLLSRDRLNATEALVVLRLEGLTFNARLTNLPEVGQRLWFYLYVDSRLAQPLKLPATVSIIEPVAGETAVTIVFDLLEEPVADLLGKLIFRQHRRLIAQQKADKRSRKEK